MSTPLLEKYLKAPGDGPNSRLNLEDWNGLVKEISGVLSGLLEKAAGFDAVSAAVLGVLLDRVNTVLGPAFVRVDELADEVEQKLALLNGKGVSADAVLDTAARVLVSPAQRDLIDTAAQAADLDAAIAEARKIGARDHMLSGW